MYKLYLNQESMKDFLCYCMREFEVEDLLVFPDSGTAVLKAPGVDICSSCSKILLGLLRVVRWDALFQNEFFWANKKVTTVETSRILGLSQVREFSWLSSLNAYEVKSELDWLPKSECCVYGTDFALFIFPVAIRVGSPYYRDFWNGSRAADKKWSAGLAVALTPQRFHLIGKCFWTMDPVLGSRNRLVFFQTGEHIWDITLCILVG